MKSTLCLAAIILATASASHAVTTIDVTLVDTITSTNGMVTVYEGVSNTLGTIGNGDNIASTPVNPVSSVCYYVDIIGESSLSIAGIAISFNDPSSIFTSLNTSLGSPTTVLGLATGVYNSSFWTTISSVPFATAFGNSDNRFIWIAGTVAITKLNDIDGSGALNLGTAHAVRTGTAASSFVALNSGGSIISGSVVPEPSSALLLVMGFFGVTLQRRRSRR